MTAWKRRNVSFSIPSGEHAVALMALVGYLLIGLIGLTYPYEQHRKPAESAQSQPPSPGPSIGSQTPQEQTESQKAQPNDAKAPVVTPSGQNPTQQPEQRTAPQTQQSSANWGDWFTGDRANWGILLLTFVLAVIGFFQWWATHTANKHYVVIERAYISMSHHPPGLNIPGLVSTGQDGGAVRDVEVYVAIKNYGNTPANVTYALVQLLNRSEPLPEHPPYDESGLKSVSVSTVKGDDFTFFHSRPISFGDIEDIRNGTSPKKLYVIGYADYIDKFGSRHRAGFGRWYNPVTDDVRLYQDENGTVDLKALNERNNLLFITQPNYNYDRERKNGEGKDWELSRQG